MTDHADYKELYLKMFRASEEAIRLLIDAQRECEELYLSSSEPPGEAISFHGAEEGKPAPPEVRFSEIH